MSAPENNPALSANSSNWCAPSGPATPGQDRRQLLACVPQATSLDHMGWQPLLLTGLLRDILTKHFETPTNIESPDLRSLIWSESESTGILIESVFRWRGELANKRPAILIRRNAYQNTRLTINDLAGADVQGSEHFMTLWVGSHSLFCVHGSGAGVESLATEVQREITQFGPSLRNYLHLFKCQVAEVGTISILEEATQSFVIPITVAWAYQETWALRPLALPLRHVDLSVNQKDC